MLEVLDRLPKIDHPNTLEHNARTQEAFIELARKIANVISYTQKQRQLDYEQRSPGSNVPRGENYPASFSTKTKDANDARRVRLDLTVLGYEALANLAHIQQAVTMCCSQALIRTSLKLWSRRSFCWPTTETARSTSPVF